MTEKAEKLHALLVRNFDTIEKQREQREPLYDTLCARLAPGTAASKLGMAIDTLPPGKRGCPYHFHYAQEEAFVVLEGNGTLRVADEMLAVKAGDVIFIPPGPLYPHQFINTSQAPFKYLSVSTRETPEICEYPDSNKYQVNASGPGEDGARHEFRQVQLNGETLDYWQGEP